MTTQLEPTIEQRKIIYQARRGLKELDIFIDPYVKQHYLHTHLMLSNTPLQNC